MTQTLTPTVQHAMVVNRLDGTHYLHVFTVESVEDARLEFGPTLTDAQAFVAGVCCTECGTEAAETHQSAAVTRTCESCGTKGCACIVVEDSHDRDVFWCLACHPQCMCRECTD